MGPKIVNSARSYSCLQIQNQGRSIVVLGYIIVRVGDGGWGRDLFAYSKRSFTFQKCFTHILQFQRLSNIFVAIFRSKIKTNYKDNVWENVIFKVANNTI